MGMRVIRRILVSAMLLTSAISAVPAAGGQTSPQPEVVIGGYGSDGVVVSTWGEDPTRRQLAAIIGPTFIAVDPVRKMLYVVSETSGAKNNLFALTFAGTRVSSVSSGGLSPVRIALSGDRLAVANYDGSVSLFALARNGAIGKRLGTAAMSGSGPDASRQEGPHPHSVTFSSTGTALWVADLGADAVVRFDLGRNRTSLREAERVLMTPGSGPRQVVPGRGAVLYVASELVGNVDVLTTSGSKTTVARRVPVRPHAQLGELVLSPDGRWLIALSRGTSECVVFAVSGDNLVESGHAACGDGPRHASFSRDGATLFVAAQRSDRVMTFAFNGRTGALTPGRSLPFSKPAVVVPITP